MSVQPRSPTPAIAPTRSDTHVHIAVERSGERLIVSGSLNLLGRLVEAIQPDHGAATAAPSEAVTGE